MDSALMPATEPFGSAYPRLWQELRRREWAAYADGEVLDRLPVDQAIFAAALRNVDGAANSPGGDGCREGIKGDDDHAAVAGDRDRLLVDHLRRRALVDHHPDVARLRDRLDERSAYGPPIDGSHGARRDLAAAMEPDVLKLIELRRALARRLGAASYAHLAAAAEGLDLQALGASLVRLREARLEAARTLAVGLTVESWFEGLDRIAGPLEGNPLAPARDVAVRLGCEDLFGSIRWTLREGPLAGWAAALSIPADIRVLLRPARSLRDLATVLHELGHALAYAATRTTGIRAIPSDTQDETMGMVVERIGIHLLLRGADRERLAAIAAAEAVRAATSALFELAVESEPGRVRELYLELFAPLVAVPDPVVWALDSFRSVDPFRIHGYALGATLAEGLLARLRRRFGEEPAAWGRWLREVLWAPGRKDTFAALAAEVARA